jgi:hypothetical protein
MATKTTALRMKAKIINTNLGMTPGVSDLMPYTMGWMQSAVANILMMVITVV